MGKRTRSLMYYRCKISTSNELLLLIYDPEYHFSLASNLCDAFNYQQRIPRLRNTVAELSQNCFSFSTELRIHEQVNDEFYAGIHVKIQVPDWNVASKHCQRPIIRWHYSQQNDGIITSIFIYLA